jgi:hypothetical protein
VPSENGSSPQQANTTPPGGSGNEQQDLEKLAKQVADRVWKLWQEELRQSRERRKSSARK